MSADFGWLLLQMEVECALLDGEQESEMAQLQKENEFLNQLKGRMPSSEKMSHPDKSKVTIYTIRKKLLCQNNAFDNCWWLGDIKCLHTQFIFQDNFCSKFHTQGNSMCFTFTFSVFDKVESFLTLVSVILLPPLPVSLPSRPPFKKGPK